MALELIGKIIKTLPVVSNIGNNGPWSKQEFVIETLDAQYPKKTAFTVWGEEKINDLKRFGTGDVVKVSFSAESREHNERWYTELRAFRIASVSGDSQEPRQAEPQQAEPRQAAPQRTAPQDVRDSFTQFDGGDDSDLPF